MKNEGPLTAERALAEAEAISKDWAGAWIDGILSMVVAASTSGMTQVAVSKPPVTSLAEVKEKLKELGYVMHSTSDQWLVVSFAHKHSPSKVA